MRGLKNPCLSIALLNAPLAVPNSSLSAKDSGMAAMFFFLNGPLLRGSFRGETWQRLTFQHPIRQAGAQQHLEEAL